MTMNHKQRIETAWSFHEPDRVPMELMISPHAQKHPRAGRVLELIRSVADNVAEIGCLNSGFFGFPVLGQEENVIEERAGEYQRKRRVIKTVAGTFTAVTYHPAGEIDFHWEKRFISSLDDFHRLAETPRPSLAYDKTKWLEERKTIGDNALAMTSLPHPLGHLVRNATMEDVYAWFYEDRATMHRFLTAYNGQIASAVAVMMQDGIGPYFAVCAHEMLLPPWMGHALFDEFVFPYDKRVNDEIHRGGGKLRAHCHGNCMDFLEKMADMGIDAIEPLEHPPGGDVDLAEAKRRVGGRMMLCGNIASERFLFMTPAEVRTQVRDAIQTAAHGGGFALCTSGGHAGTCMLVPDEVMSRILANVEAYILAGVEFGQYPIKV